MKSDEAMSSGLLFAAEGLDTKPDWNVPFRDKAPQSKSRISRCGGYQLSGVCLTGALVMRALFDGLWSDRLAYAWFFFAVLIVARFAKTGPQILTAFGGLLLGNYFFVQPRHSFLIEQRIDLINTSIYCLVALLTIRISARARQTVQQKLTARDRIVGILECTSDAVCTLNRNWQVTYFNKRASELTNQDVAQTVGRNYWELWPEFIGTSFETAYRRVMQDSERVQFEERHPIKDQWIEVHACAYGEGIAIFFRDVTDRKRADATRANLAAIVASSDDAIIGESINGKISTWNEAAERLYGYSREEAVGSSFAALFQMRSTERVPLLLERVRTGERIDHLETTQKTKGGEIVTVSLTISPVQSEDQQIIGVSIQARDISERKRHESEREELIKRLRSALAEVKRLSGLLPICSSCKKIRDDKGYWNQLEAFIVARSDAKFTHGFCPDCASELYPKFYSRDSS